MRNAAATRSQILRQAGRLFNSKGYKATSISHITTATGYTKGAIYRHFQNKEKLEEQTLIYLTGLMYEELRKRIREQENAPSKLRAILTFFASYSTNPPIKGGCPLLNAAVEADDGSPILRKRALSILTTLRESIQHILEQGIRRHQFRSGIDKEAFATIMIASLEGAIMMSKLSRTDNDLQTIVTHLDKMIQSIEQP